MAKAQKKPAAKSVWRGYHQVNLTDEQMFDFDTWVKSGVAPFLWLDALIADGYKVSFSFDNYHGGVSCSIYAAQEKMDWAGFSLTAWDETPDAAYLLAAYKHFIVCNQIWDVAKDVPEKTYRKRG